MRLRKYDGEADGWLTAVAKRRGTGWDEEDAPFQLIAGEKYYIQGDYDPNVFEVYGSVSPNGEEHDWGDDLGEIVEEDE